MVYRPFFYSHRVSRFIYKPFFAANLFFKVSRIIAPF